MPSGTMKHLAGSPNPILFYAKLAYLVWSWLPQCLQAHPSPASEFSFRIDWLSEWASERAPFALPIPRCCCCCCCAKLTHSFLSLWTLEHFGVWRVSFGWQRYCLFWFPFVMWCGCSGVRVLWSGDLRVSGDELVCKCWSGMWVECWRGFLLN